MIGRAARALAVLAAMLCAAASAVAHLMPQGQGSVRVDAEGIFAVISIPASAFTGFDTDGNGRMSLGELNANRDALIRQSSELLRFRGDGVAGQPMLRDLLIPHLHDASSPQDTDYVIAMQRDIWAKPPANLSIEVDPRVGSSLALAAVRGSEQESVMLTPLQPQHRFFEGRAAMFQRFLLLGAEHIWEGWDHLLFLLAVLAAGTGWRYWGVVVTSFTVAHSVTLALAAAGVVTIPPAVSEPLILTSIALVALHNWRRRNAPLRQHAAIVFGCGLIHGLGFATAFKELGGSDNLLLPLLGFNLGVEAGQMMFVALALGGIAMVRHLRMRRA